MQMKTLEEENVYVTDRKRLHPLPSCKRNSQAENVHSIDFHTAIWWSWLIFVFPYWR